MFIPFLPLTNSSAKEKFDRLKTQWKQETEMLSSIKKKIRHPAYQEIISMGDEAIPLILEELKTEPDHWFSALSILTKIDPVSTQDNFNSAVDAWLNWGRIQGYID